MMFYVYKFFTFAVLTITSLFGAFMFGFVSGDKNARDLLKKNKTTEQPTASPS